MKDFNLIEDNLDKCKKYHDLYIIGKRGNLDSMRKKIKNWDAGDNSEASLLIYNADILSESIAWKNVKKNSKGLFIQHSTGRIYLDEFK